MNATTQEQPKLPTIPISLIDPSPTQPRTTFRDIEALGENIKIHGVLQPLLLRPFPKKPGRYECVFGERRLRGGKVAGLKDIPAIVRDIGDAEVVEIQIVENAKRDDIHPLEEATAYETLHKKHGYSVDEIAAKVGKSTATIYARLKFSSLCPESKKAFAEDKISAAIATLLVRVPHPDLQKEATKAILQRYYGAPVSLREAANIIEHQFMMELGKAPFDTKDATLLDKTPACTTCPKRTGNQAHLFEDASSKNLCTDPKCFQAKVEADWTKKKEDAKKRQLPILEGKKAQEALAYSGEYVDLDKPNYDDPKNRTYRQMLAKTKADVPVALAKDTDGRAHELVNRKDLEKIGVIPKAKSATNTFAAEEKKRREKAKKDREKAASITEQLVEKSFNVRAPKFERDFARVLAAGVARLVWHDTAKMICTRREIAVPSGSTPIKALAKYAGALDTGACRALVVEILASNEDTRKELSDLFKLKA